MVRTVRPSAAIALPPPSPGSTACSSSPPAPSSIPFSPTHLPPRRRIAAVRTAACYVTAAAAASAAGEDHAVLHHTTQPASAPSFIAVKEDFPLLIIAEDVEEEALATLTRNKLSGMIKVAATKAPSFGEQKTQCLEDIAIITGGTVVREDMGYTLEDSGKEVLGSASKVVIKKDSTLIVTDGSTLHAVEKRVAQIKGQVEMFAH